MGKKLTNIFQDHFFPTSVSACSRTEDVPVYLESTAAKDFDDVTLEIMPLVDAR